MWQVTVPVHEQESFAETLDASIAQHDQERGATDPGPLSADDARLRDYLVRKVKEIMVDAPIVATHLVATISGHANNGGNVFVPGTGVSPGFTIAVSAAAEVPAQPPIAQQEQTTAVPGALAPPEPGVGVNAPGQAGLEDAGDQGTPFDAPAEPSDAPAGEETAATESEPLTKWGANVPAGGVTAEDEQQHLTETGGPGQPAEPPAVQSDGAPA